MFTVRSSSYNLLGNHILALRNPKTTTYGPKNWKKGKVVNQKFTFNLEQLREANPDEDLGVGAVHALTVGMDNMMNDMNIDPSKYDLGFLLEKLGTYLPMITFNDQSALNRC